MPSETKCAVEFRWNNWSEGESSKTTAKEETVQQDSTSSLPTVCSSSNASEKASESDSDHKTWSTSNSNEKEDTGKFSYKEVLLMNDYSTSCAVPHLDEPQLVVVNPKRTEKNMSTINENRQQKKSSLEKRRDNLQYTREHTNGEKFARLGGSRMDTTVIREAISQAISQGMISKSTKRELRQSLLRGDVGSVLEALRRECHLRPLVVPMDHQFPTEFELRCTNGLLKCVDQYSSRQDSDVLAKKHIVLKELERMVDVWVERVANHKQRRERPTSCVYVGGSWYLKVDTNESDMNIVALVPLWMTKEDFYSTLQEDLLQRSEVNWMSSEEGNITSLHFTFNDIKVELFMARFSQNHVPKNLPIHSDHILSGLDYPSVRSLSGPRVAALILELVPNPIAFRSCLQAVRFWARRRGLYSSRVGFLGGISWSILVALICQMLPKATPAGLLHQFFTVLAQWKWPTPVLLSRPYDAGLGCRQWSPTHNIHERSHVMPIVTPGYPAVNSAVNVNFSTLRILHEEFLRGKIIIDGMIMKGLSSPNVWAKLFEPTDFCIRYNHYLCVELTASNENDLHRFKCYVEARLRKLVESLQHTKQILTVHPLPTAMPFTSNGEKDEKCCRTFFVGFEIVPNETRNAQQVVSPVMNYFLATEIHGSSQFEQGSNQMDALIVYMPWNKLPSQLFPLGKGHAAGERAKFVLRQAHDMHMMSKTPVAF